MQPVDIEKTKANIVEYERKEGGNRMTELHCWHLQADIDQYKKSIAEKMVDKLTLKQEMVDNWSTKPTLAEKLVVILAFVADKDKITTEAIVAHFGFPATSAKRYLRQLTDYGYLESRGGNWMNMRLPEISTQDQSSTSRPIPPAHTS